MPQHGRREFLETLGTFAVLPTLRARADLVLWNADLLTMDGRQPAAQAVAIAGERLLAVGSNDDVLNLASPGTKKIDLGDPRREDRSRLVTTPVERTMVGGSWVFEA